jgi:hypothetical protein
MGISEPYHRKKKKKRKRKIIIEMGHFVGDVGCIPHSVLDHRFKNL